MWILLPSGTLVSTEHMTQVQKDRDDDGQQLDDEVIVRWADGTIVRFIDKDARVLYNTIATTDWEERNQ